MNKVEQLCMGCMADKVGEGICPECGYDSRSAYDQSYLAPGTMLSERYIIGALKHRNGERGEYIGYDTQQEISVWVREYFPYTIAHRENDGKTVMPDSGYGAQYKALMSDFVDVCNEVKRLSVSDPVIPIENIIGENNTVYGVYKHLDVLSLEEYLTTQGGRLSYDQAVELLTPLFHAVDNMHLRGVIHRGLSPYTILVSPSGTIYMDEFSLSGTRTAGSELQAELFNGYSAPEQYAAKGWQGTWTDVYAIAAVFYRTVSGVVPPKSTTLSGVRALAPLADLVSSVPQRVSQAVSNAMETNTNQRTQTVGTFISAIHADEDAPSTAVFDFVPTIGDSPSSSRRRYQDDLDEFGHTEEVNLDEIESQFIFDDTAPPPVEPPRPTRRQASQPQQSSDRYDDYGEYDDYGYDSQSTGSGVSRAIVVAIVAVMVVVGVVAAVIFSNRIINPDREESQPEQSSGMEAPEPPTSPSPSSESESESSESEEEKEEVEIPALEGQTIDVVEKNAEYQDLYKFTVTEVDDPDTEKGEIISQHPPKGRKVEVKEDEKIEIKLVVSKGTKKLTMPNVTGMSYDDAVSALDRFARAEGVVFEVGAPVRIYAAGTPEGIVVRSVPEPGQPFNPETDKVELHISRGEESSSSQPESSASQSESSKEESSSQPSRTKDDDGKDVSPNKPPSRN